jgi:hypothetical protein
VADIDMDTTDHQEGLEVSSRSLAHKRIVIGLQLYLYKQ